MIKITIYGAANRPELWNEFYNNIKTNLSFEIIFVGENKPNFKLPSNFQYIYSTVKPTQCSEIALRQAKGEILILAADDFVYSPYSFDCAYTLYQIHNNYKLMIPFRYFERGIEVTQRHSTPPFSSFTRSLIMMPTGFISKKFINEIGRVDKNFICGFWENDLVMRAYAAGGSCVFCEGAKVSEDHKLKSTYTEYWKVEDKLFFDLWFHGENQIKKDVPLQLKRKRPFEPFGDENLLTISQGNKGKWK